ncbi:MAG TPA: lamin tail domain-containing protein, partial [Chthoniobacteraceae bacterium]
MCAHLAVRIWSLVFVAQLALTSIAPAQQLVINEIMAAGQSILADEDGAFPDFVEIANVGPEAVNLAGWHLTDSAEKPLKWTFPARTIPAGGYAVVFASGRDRAPEVGALHASFSLKSGGEYLALATPGGAVVSSVTYPVQLPDVSYEPAGQRFFGEPTPGAANTTASLAIAAAPVFSEAHGFKTAAFQLSLSSNTGTAAIRYTTDGSEPTENNGALYSAPIQIKKTSVIRAAAFLDNAQPSPTVTRTYLFIDDIVTQSLDGKRPEGWPKKWGMNRVDYGLDPRIVTRAPAKNTIKDDLQTIPSLSIVTDLKHLFDATTGIYANPQSKGDEWERPMSIELINPDGTPGFQVNAGVRIRGGASRDAENPKHSFRVLFRKEYGAPELKYPLFGPDGAQNTSRFDIRCEQLVAWHHFPDPEADFLRDIYGRDTQGALGQPYKRGDFHHLYINGQYWGLYQTDERVTADYAAEYFGGDEEDYDVVKYDAESSFGTGFTDGTFGSWRRLFDAGAQGFVDNADYFRVQGLNPDGSRNRSYERLLDVDNLIDYMLAGIFICADDTPPAFGTQNNWYAVRSRKDDFGFRFFAHDWEISMRDALEDRVGEAPTVSPFEDGFVNEPGSTNPWHYWQAMRLNPEFRLRVADRVQRAMFNGGPLTTEVARARWQRRMDEIDRAIVGESARWGDARQEGIRPFKGARQVAAEWRGVQQKARSAAEDVIIIDPLPEPGPISGPGPRPGPRPEPTPTPTKKPKPFTRDDWFAAANDRVLNGFLVVRSEAMLQHLKAGGLFPTLAAPQVEPHGGPLPLDSRVTLVAPDMPSGGAAEVYYTTDGSDPRRIGGAVSSEARLYTQPFALVRQTTVKSRAKSGPEWSALAEVEFTPGVDYRDLRITEILYNAPGSGGALDRDYEFLELKNLGAAPLDLSGAKFTAGIDFTFPQGTSLTPGTS